MIDIEVFSPGNDGIGEAPCGPLPSKRSTGSTSTAGSSTAKRHRMSAAIMDVTDYPGCLAELMPAKSIAIVMGEGCSG